MNRIKEFIDRFYANYITKLQMDHVLHAYVSTVLFLVFFSLGNLVFTTELQSAGFSFLLTFLIGYFKEEIIDKMIRKGQFETKDLFADFIGTCIGLGCLIIIWICR